MHMLDRIKYVNHLNEAVLFGEDGLYINKANVRDYTWKYKTQYKRIENFEREIQTRSVPIVIVGSDCRSKANQIYELIEKDVLANKPGRLVIGNYYCEGYLYANKHTEFCRPQVLAETLSFVTDRPYWTKETFNHFEPASESESLGLDYPYDYPYDYVSTTSLYELSNTDFVANAFKIVIYGECSNPSISIGGHVYSVEVDINEDEYLTIDSRAKTIIKTDSIGNAINAFSGRNRTSYIFEAIKTGRNSIVVNGGFSFDITLYSERSEPEWT